MKCQKQNPARKPIFGLCGGIGSGKSFVAELFSQLGCRVIDSDRLAREELEDPELLSTLRSWWGDSVVTPQGRAHRHAIAQVIFHDPTQRERLNGLIHPRVAARREMLDSLAMADPTVLAVIWDTPLLFETHLNQACDAVVFVQSQLARRLERVIQTRGWNAQELERREKSQWPLDKKEKLSNYIVHNDADAAASLLQVREILSHVLSTFRPLVENPVENPRDCLASHP